MILLFNGATKLYYLRVCGGCPWCGDCGTLLLVVDADSVVSALCDECGSLWSPEGEISVFTGTTGPEPGGPLRLASADDLRTCILHPIGLHVLPQNGTDTRWALNNNPQQPPGVRASTSYDRHNVDAGWRPGAHGVFVAGLTLGKVLERALSTLGGDLPGKSVAVDTGATIGTQLGNCQSVGYGQPLTGLDVTFDVTGQVIRVFPRRLRGV